jgi:hypothetical protein
LNGAVRTAFQIRIKTVYVIYDLFGPIKVRHAFFGAALQDCSFELVFAQHFHAGDERGADHAFLIRAMAVSTLFPSTTLYGAAPPAAGAAATLAGSAAATCTGAALGASAAGATAADFGAAASGFSPAQAVVLINAKNTA